MKGMLMKRIITIIVLLFMLCIILPVGFSKTNKTYAEALSIKSTPAPVDIVLQGVNPKISINGDSVSIAWEAVENAEGYYIYRSDKGDINSFEKISTTSQTHYDDIKVNPGVKYHYQVEAYHNNIISSVSKTVSIALPTPKPLSVPGNIEITNKGSYNLISWNKVEGAKRYVIYRSTLKDSNYERITATWDLELFDYGIKEGATYYYKVTSINNSTESKPSTPKKIFVPTPTPKPTLKPTPKPTPTPKPSPTPKPLKVPTNIKVSYEGTYNLISWSKVKDATSYVVYRSSSKDKGFEEIATTWTLQYRDASARSGKTYYYQVASANASTKSKPSAPKKFFMPTPSPKPTATPISYQRMSYKTLARNPEFYKGQAVKITNCRVVQQIDDNKSSDIEVIVTVGGYNNNVMYLTVPGFKDWEWGGSFKKTGVSRLLDGDKIDITGIVLGEYTYETIDNRTLTVPLIEVDYMWLYD